jgi:sporulation protein YlmC with PRC-barrel domain
MTQPGDPQLDPRTAPIIDQDHNQTFARRTVSFFISLVLIVVVVCGFLFWFVLPSDDDPSVSQAERQPATETYASSPQMQQSDSENSNDQGVVDMVAEAIEPFTASDTNSPASGPQGDVGASLAMQEYINETARPEMAERAQPAAGIINSFVWDNRGENAGKIQDILIDKSTGRAQAILVREDNSFYAQDLALLEFDTVQSQEEDGDIHITISEDTLEQQPDFNYDALRQDENFLSLQNLERGQVLDVDGNVVGNIENVFYRNAEVQRIYFRIAPALVPAGGDQILSLPYESGEIVDTADGFDIQLTRDQTIALAEALLPPREGTRNE